MIGITIIVVIGAALIFDNIGKANQEAKIMEVADKWAETWESRDGKARFELMSSEMQKDFYDEQLRNNGEDGIWIIRWSSPWVESYDIHLEGEQAVITYKYTDSTGAKYEGIERLSFGAENGKLLVIKSMLEKEIV